MGAELDATGFASAQYAQSYVHEGELVQLSSSGTWVVTRAIDEAPGYVDAVGLYPLMVCSNWDSLCDEISTLRDFNVVSLTAVIDPCAKVDRGTLTKAFPDCLREYKWHSTVCLDQYDPAVLPRHHRRNLRLGLRRCAVRLGQSDSDRPDVLRLYEDLRVRHDVTGRADLPGSAILAQLEAPGAVLFVAEIGERIVGMQLWMCSGDVAYYHLGACDQDGYDNRAAYVLTDRALRYFASRASIAHLGGGAGVLQPDVDDGLVRFKDGWASAWKLALLGGVVLDRSAYAQLCVGTTGDRRYFPLYRAGVDLREKGREQIAR